MNISDLVIPVLILGVIAFSLFRKRPVYSDFILGAKDGIKTAFDIMPQLVGLIVAIKVFDASGGMEFIVRLIEPLASILHFPSEIVPFALMRPLSGSGSLALATGLFEKYGTDSMIGRIISVMMGSTETTLYTVAIYFGAVGVKNTRHTLLCALSADLISMILSVIVCTVMF